MYTLYPEYPRSDNYETFYRSNRMRKKRFEREIYMPIGIQCRATTPGLSDQQDTEPPRRV